MQFVAAKASCKFRWRFKAQVPDTAHGARHIWTSDLSAVALGNGRYRSKFVSIFLVLAVAPQPATLTPLPLFADSHTDREDLENQWIELGYLPLTDIIDDLEPETNIDDVNIVQFWGNVLDLKNAGGERKFEKLALFALSALTLPISNAVVERAFSVMSCIKCRRRNRLQLRMIEALMRLRIHLKV